MPLSDLSSSTVWELPFPLPYPSRTSPSPSPPPSSLPPSPLVDLDISSNSNYSTDLSSYPKFETDNLDSVISGLDRLSNKCQHLKEEHARLELQILDEESKLIKKKSKLNSLEKELEELSQTFHKTELLKRKLNTILNNLDQEVVNTVSKIRGLNRELLESMKVDLRHSFVETDQLITEEVKPILTQLTTTPNLAPETNLAKICHVCVKEEGDQDDENSFKRRTALIPCGHSFCHSCAAYAYEYHKCHLCNYDVDGILDLFL